MCFQLLQESDLEPECKRQAERYGVQGLHLGGPHSYECPWVEYDEESKSYKYTGVLE